MATSRVRFHSPIVLNIIFRNQKLDATAKNRFQILILYLKNIFKKYPFFNANLLNTKKKIINVGYGVFWLQISNQMSILAVTENPLQSGKARNFPDYRGFQNKINKKLTFGGSITDQFKCITTSCRKKGGVNFSGPKRSFGLRGRSVDCKQRGTKWIAEGAERVPSCRRIWYFRYSLKIAFPDYKGFPLTADENWHRI